MSDWIVSFDASTLVPTIVLGRVDEESERLVGGDEMHGEANQASATLVPRITALVAEAGIALSELASIACGRGPGTFTGTRVAAAAAKGLALGLGVQVLPVSTLAALAAGVEGDGRVLALLDARRGEVYGGFFELEGMSVRLLGEERCAGLAELLRDDLGADSQLRLVGPGVEPYLDQVPPALRRRARHTAGLNTRGLWRATVSARRSSPAVAPEALQVSYLRASYAEMGINTPKRPVKRSRFLDDG